MISQKNARYLREAFEDPTIADYHGNESRISEGMIEAMEKAQVPQPLIYAFIRTGRVVTEATQQNLSDSELVEWDAAVKAGERS